MKNYFYFYHLKGYEKYKTMKNIHVLCDKMSCKKMEQTKITLKKLAHDLHMWCFRSVVERERVP